MLFIQISQHLEKEKKISTIIRINAFLVSFMEIYHKLTYNHDSE